MTERRVVVTGLGLLSPLGNSVQENWQNALLGKSGISQISYFDTDNYTTNFAGSLKDFRAEDYLEKKEIRRIDPFIQFGLISANECIKDSNINLDLLFIFCFIKNSNTFD